MKLRTGKERGQNIQGFADHCKDFAFSFECDGESLENYEQGSKII